MRILEILKTIERYQNDKYLLKYENINGQPRIRNLKNFHVKIKALKEIEAFESYINNFKQYVLTIEKQKTHILAINLEEIFVDGASYNGFQNIEKQLQNFASSYTKILETLLPKDVDNTISIKLPNTMDLDNIIKNTKDINTYIKQVISHKKIGGELTINSWENGSFWLNLTLETSAAVAMIGAVTWSAVVINNMIQKNKLQTKELELLELKEESLKDILEKQKKAGDLLIEAEAKNIHEHHIGGNANPEYILRLKNTILVFANLIQEGTQINTDLISNEVDLIKEFPNFNQLDKVESKIKKIENKSS